MALHVSDEFRRLCRFLLVGGGATLLDCLVFALLIWWMPAYPNTGFVVAFATSVCCRFAADKFFTFQNTKKTYLRQFILYCIGCTLTLGVGLLVFSLVLALGISEILSKLISIPFVTASGYLIFRHIVFLDKGKIG